MSFIIFFFCFANKSRSSIDFVCNSLYVLSSLLTISTISVGMSTIYILSVIAAPVMPLLAASISKATPTATNLAILAI